MKKILIIGASGFVGGRLARALLAAGHPIRCLARAGSRVEGLAGLGAEIIEGDIADPGAVGRALDSVEAVYISIHTLSPQPGGGARARFMEIEKAGLGNVVAACRALGVRRAIYVTSLGISPDEPSEWLRERWHAEQLLLKGGLDATVIRPGYIAGTGGRGFDACVGQAGRRVAITLGGDRPRMRTIAVDDLVGYLVGVLDDPRSFGQCYDVGNDDILSMNQSIDVIAGILGKRRPRKVQVPPALLGALAPLLERLAGLPAGAAKGFVDGIKVDCIGDPGPIRALLPRPLLSFREAVERALEVKPA